MLHRSDTHVPVEVLGNLFVLFILEIQEVADQQKFQYVFRRGHESLSELPHKTYPVVLAHLYIELSDADFVDGGIANKSQEKSQAHDAEDKIVEFREFSFVLRERPLFY